jgi:dolichol-phosphate mannosyltransferase
MIYILLPAYNEEHSIDRLFDMIRSKMGSMQWDYRIIVCNDGSIDKTQQKLEYYAKRMPVQVISHKYNRGLGETARDLIEHAVEVCGDDDAIVRMDCDATHEPEYLERLILKLQEGYDVVVASRFLPGGGQLGVDSYRAFISRGASLFMKLILPIPGLKDFSCGFRAYRGSILKKAVSVYKNDFVQLKGLGFTCTLEKVMKLKIIGAKFAEVPFVLRYDKKMSSSKMVSSITMLGYLVMAFMYHWPWGGWRQGYRKLRNATPAKHENN